MRRAVHRGLSLGSVPAAHVLERSANVAVAILMASILVALFCLVTPVTLVRLCWLYLRSDS
jgi:hypothetical protein